MIFIYNKVKTAITITTTKKMAIFPKDVIIHIMSFITEPVFTPISIMSHILSNSFIEETQKSMFGSLSRNKNAIYFLEKNPQLINWFCISQNPNAIHLLEMYPEKINWSALSLNPNAIHLLEKNIKKIDWFNIVININAYSIISQNMDIIMSNTIYFKRLCLNQNPKILKLIEKYPEKIDWGNLSYNPAAIYILERNIEKISWVELSENVNAIKLIEANLEKVDWELLSLNKNAIHLIEKNLDKINWAFLSENHNAINILKNNIENINYFHLCSNTNPEFIKLAYYFINMYDIKYYMHKLMANPVIFEKNDLLTYKKINNTYFNYKT